MFLEVSIFFSPFLSLKNDSVYSCLFFFLTALHFFHLLVGLFLCCLSFYNCSFIIGKLINVLISFIFWQTHPSNGDPSLFLGFSFTFGSSVIRFHVQCWFPDFHNLPIDDFSFTVDFISNILSNCCFSIRFWGGANHEVFFTLFWLTVQTWNRSLMWRLHIFTWGGL